MIVAHLIKKINWQLWLILLLALILRSYRITNPALDWHAFRQADTASVSREFVKHGINLLQPKYQDLSNIQSGLDNLSGYRMVEFPLVNGLVAISSFGDPLKVELVSRIYSVIFSLLFIFSLYYLVKEIEQDNEIALLTSFIAAILPYSVYYSRAILPEPALLMLSTLSLTAYVYYLTNKPKAYIFYFLAMISLTVALLIKPFALFLYPVFVALGLYYQKLFYFKKWENYLLLVLPIVPFYLWREWIKNFPTGIPASDWLFNGNDIRFRPAWFRWIFWERITKLISGYFLLIFYLANLTKIDKKSLIYAIWWLSLIAYCAIIATGNVQHDYYQVIFIPIVSISAARGMYLLKKILNSYFIIHNFKSLWSYVITYSILSASILFSYNQLAGYFNVNHWEYYHAGQKANELLPKSAKVIAPAFGDTQFLFQTNRVGWPIGFEIEQKIKLGAEYYVNTSFDDETNALMKKHPIIYQSPDFVIIDLTRSL